MGVRATMEMETTGEEACPDSWELADLETSMLRLMPPSTSNIVNSEPTNAAESSNNVDEFLRDALQNPHDRMNILRLEQEVQKFVKNPAQQQLEFAPMPSSYMRLAAHRVAQHYFLQTSVLDSSSAEGCRIIVRKSGETRWPVTRLADVPVTTFQDVDNSTNEAVTTKFVIKQRPQGRSRGTANKGTSGCNNNPSKSVEERNEEYNKARARIFRTEKEKEQRAYDELVELESKQQSSKTPETTNKEIHENSAKKNHVNSSSSSSSSNSVNKAPVKEQVAFSKSKQKVAIFRDREKDRKDPDYDRNYDRYSQRFDPGFGLGNAPQPAFGARYTPVVNYNTEFPQLGGPPVRPMPGQAPHMGGQHVQGWNPGYQRQDMLRPSYNPAAGPHSNMATYMSQYAYPQAYSYSSQISQLPEPGSAQARRR